MTEQELVELCSLGENTTVQFKLEFTTPKQIAEELAAFANTHGGTIVFGAEDKTGRMVGLTYEQLQYTSRELRCFVPNIASKLYGLWEITSAAHSIVTVATSLELFPKCMRTQCDG